MRNDILKGDCLELMKNIPDGSIDMILCDLPYGTTACKWDKVIDFTKLWAQYERIIKPNGAIVLTASQPFTSALVMSNIKLFRCEWIWEKTKSSNFMQASRQPLKQHESVLIFSKKQTFYNPIKTQVPKGRIDKRKVCGRYQPKEGSVCEGLDTFRKVDNGERYPVSVQRFSNSDKTKNMHPTQKPVALFEYLIKTYTNAGDLVLDNCAGSGTTAIACINTNRKFIVIEQDEKYFEIMRARIDQHAELF